MAEIPKERLERARAEIEAAEAAKPQPAMTDELRADVAQRREAMIAGQENDYKRPRAEAKEAEEAEEAEEQTAESAQQASDAMNELAAAGQSATEGENDGSTDTGSDPAHSQAGNRRKR